MAFLWLVSLLIGLLAVTRVTSKSAIVDTDIGDDFDDMMALALMSSQPNSVNLEAVIVSSFNTTKRAMMVAYAFDCFYGARMSPSQYPPIVMGISGEDTSPMYQFSYVPSNFTMDDYIKRGGRVIGLKDIISVIENWSISDRGELRYIEIAPVSSLAYIIQAIDTKYLSNMRVFTMNGAISKGYNGKAPAVIEYNVEINIGASALMYANAHNFYTQDGSPGIVVSPLDTTVYHQYGGDLWQMFLNYNTSSYPLMYTMLNAYEHWYESGGKNNDALLPFSPKTGTSTMYDVQAAYSALLSFGKTPCDMLDPYLVYECVPVRVNATGFTVIDKDHGQLVAEAIGFPSTNPYVSVNDIGEVVMVLIVDGHDEKLSFERALFD